MKPLLIGLMDSGMGGISVLNQMDNILQGTRFIYYGDLKNSPYGDKSREEVNGHTLAAVDFLVAHGAEAVVIACNTATSVAIEVLRQKYTIPVFGMEPALKPAAFSHQKIAVLATSLTLNEDKFLSLKRNLDLARKDLEIQHFPCDGLAALIDKGDRRGAEEFLEPILKAAENEGVHAIVLGCTHYVFLKDFIKERGFRTYDGNEGTVRHLLARMNVATTNHAHPEIMRGTNTLELFLNTDNKMDYKIAESYLNKRLKERSVTTQHDRRKNYL